MSVYEVKPGSIDIASQEIYEGGVPHDGFRFLREHDPVHWHPWDWAGGGFWALTKHADVVKVSKDPTRSRPPRDTSTSGISSRTRSRRDAR